MQHEPAFPTKLVYPPVFGRYEHEQYFPGMSLRDYFAAKAMNGFLTGIAMNAPWPAIESLSKKSYEVADAMIAERSKNTGEGK